MIYKILTSVFIFICFMTSYGQENVLGTWKGITMSQNENGIGSQTFFLPNEGEMIISSNYMDIYYYPYFKKERLPIRISKDAIFYENKDKSIRCDYELTNDTLVFRMGYIDKQFIKLFTRTNLDTEVINELDTYGYRIDMLVHEFELDTLMIQDVTAQNKFDSLSFTPFKHLQFIGRDSIRINRAQTICFKRLNGAIVFDCYDDRVQLGIKNLNSNQRIIFEAKSVCSEEMIALPFITVSWADRIRQAIIDEENF